MWRGSKRIPELARSLGKAKAEFEKGLSSNDKESANRAEEAPKAGGS